MCLSIRTHLFLGIAMGSNERSKQLEYTKARVNHLVENMILLVYMYIKKKLEYTNAEINHLVEKWFLVYINHSVHDAQSKQRSQ